MAKTRARKRERARASKLGRERERKREEGRRKIENGGEKGFLAEECASTRSCREGWILGRASRTTCICTYAWNTLRGRGFNFPEEKNVWNADNRIQRKKGVLLNLATPSLYL